MNVKLTATQTTALKAAANRRDGNIEPLPATLRGGARTKVIEGLLARGLAAGADGHMRIAHAHGVEQQGRGEHGAAAAEDRQQQADERAAHKRGNHGGGGKRDHAGVRLFHGAAAIRSAIPHQPLTPANSRPAPRKAGTAMKAGCTKVAAATPASISTPMTICT